MVKDINMNFSLMKNDKLIKKVLLLVFNKYYIFYSNCFHNTTNKPLLKAFIDVLKKYPLK